jgi:hypothetical protein
VKTNQPRVIISVLDPAIDKSRTDLKKYIVERDVSCLVLKGAMEPTRYFVRHLGTKLFNSVIDAATSDALKWQLAFQFGVVEVQNLDGRQRYVPEGEPNPNGGIPVHLTDDQLEDFAPAVIQEIGQIVYQSAFLGRGSTVSFRLLPSLLSHLTAAVVRDAEQAQSEPPSSSSDASSLPDDSEPGGAS